MTTLGQITRLLRMMANPALAVRLDVVRGAGAEAGGITLSVLGPYLLKLLVDGLAAGTVSPPTLLAYVALFALSWAGTSTMASLKMVYTTRIIDRMTRDLLGRALRSQLPAIAAERTGDSGRILGLVERLPFSLQVVVGGLVWQAGPLLMQIGVSLAVITALVPIKYGLIMAAILIAYAAAVHVGAGRYQARAHDANAATGQVSQATGDVLRNARRVVFNGNVDGELETISARAEAKRLANQRLSWALVQFSGLQYAAVGAGMAVLLIIAGFDVRAGAITVGDFVLLQAYVLRLALPLSGFGFMMRQAAVSLANLRDVFDLIRGSEEREGGTPARSGPAEIRLDDVSFRYGPGLGGIAGVSAALESGGFIAIVGPNGSGKSTLAQLIAGLLEPDAGTIRIDGQNLAGIPRAERHRHVLYVPQHLGLFNRTLRANALYPPTARSEAELAQTLTNWGFYEDGRPIDFDLLVGEQGERLSGGQVQKLELARLIGVDVPAVILDESTSSLDVRSEGRAISSLRASFPGRTTLILVTHRERLAREADQVLFLSGGRLAGLGPHPALLAERDDYARLWTAAA